jgi:hypothetical protein
MDAPGPLSAATKPKLRWYQFSLRALFVVVTLCAIPCSWLAVKLQEARRRHERVLRSYAAGNAIIKAGGEIGAGGLPDGRMSFVVSFRGKRFTKDCLNPLRDLELTYGVDLAGTLVTDADLDALVGVEGLQELRLEGTTVTDAGLEALSRLENLRILHLEKTHVTDIGVARLQTALPNCKIFR